MKWVDFYNGMQRKMASKKFLVNCWSEIIKSVLLVDRYNLIDDDLKHQSNHLEQVLNFVLNILILYVT